MKKSLIMAASVLALAGMTACNGKQAATEADETTAAEKVAYTGIVPAADCDGIWYTLQLNDGKYDLIETYFAVDTTANFGISEILSVKSEGDYSKVDNNGRSYLKFTPGVNDSAAQTLNFLVDTDSTIVMVNADLETPATPDYYTLKAVK